MYLVYHIAAAIAGVVILQVVITRVKLSKEGRRRIQHAATGQLLIMISYVLPLATCQVALSAGILLLLCVYLFCKKWYRENFEPLLRPSEQNSLPGAFWFLVGTALCATCFDLRIGRYAVLCLSYADPMAAWVGSSVKSPKLVGSASLAGSVACFATAIATGWFVLSDDGLEIAVGAMACTVAECLPVWNDNLLIPVVTCSVLQAFQSYR